MKKSTFSIQLK